MVCIWKVHRLLSRKSLICRRISACSNLFIFSFYVCQDAKSLPYCWRAPCHSHRWVQIMGLGNNVSEANEAIRNYCQQMFMNFSKKNWSAHLGHWKCHGSICLRFSAKWYVLGISNMNILQWKEFGKYWNDNERMLDWICLLVFLLKLYFKHFQVF